MRIAVCLALFFGYFFPPGKTRTIDYNGKAVNTTYDVPLYFYGVYEGHKEGFLKLNEDGTGIYRYDVFGFALGSCKDGEIRMEWGFLVDENDSLVAFDREYGKSYPLLMKSVSDTQFQGCRKEVMLDFVMVYENGKLGVSSSDDWEKTK